MEDLSLHILDIAENAIQAGARSIKITIEEDLRSDLMKIVIEDNGKGMGAEFLEKAFDPFVTTRTTRRVGLGLPLLHQAARMAGGEASIESELGRGTKVNVSFQHSHIDRKPLGDMAQTIITLIAGRPELEFRYEHRKDDNEYILDTRGIKEVLEGVPINNPEVLNFIKEDLNKGLRTLATS